MSRSPASRRPVVGTALRLAPWGVAALLVWLLVRQVPLAQTLAAFQRADLWLLLPTAVGCVVAWFWLDSFGLSYVFTRFNAPLPPREARSVRALTYLLALVNWNLASGAIVVHLRHAKGVPLVEAASTLFFYGLIDGLILTSLACAGSLLLPPSPALHSIALVTGVLVVLELATISFFLWKSRPSWRWMTRIATLRIFRTHERATLRDALVVIALRGLYFLMFVLFFALALPSFGATVPLAHIAATVPAVLMMGGLPITPAGLGTQQAAVVYFYRAYAPEAELLALGFVLPIVFVLMRAPLSLLYLRDLGRLRAEIAAERSDVAGTADLATSPPRG